MNEKKLLLHERVEVRQFEEGLRGSWHPGIIVGVSELNRSVMYDELLSETGHSKLIESIDVTGAIEGLDRRYHIPSTYRGHIRPLPPKRDPNPCNSKLSFGVCVDAYFEDAWWEGVIFDTDNDSYQRVVYFPDEDDERKFNVRNLRVTRVWDEHLNQWRDRGDWVLVELSKGLEIAQLSHFIKRIWLRLRSNYGFIKMISEWTCSIQSLWRQYFREAVDEITVECNSNAANHKISLCLSRKKGRKTKVPQQLLAESESGKSETASTSNISRLGSRKTRKVKFCNSRNYCTCQNKKYRFGVCPSARKQLLVRKSSTLKKLHPILITKHKSTRHTVHTPTMVKEATEDLHEHDNQPVSKRRIVTKPKEIKAFSQENCRVLDAIGTQNDTSTSLQHQVLHFAKSGSNVKLKGTVSPQKLKNKRRLSCRKHDPTCIICQDDGEDIILCYNCPSSYHGNCINLKDVPEGIWFCPLCCCGLCELRSPHFDNKLFSDICYQCSRQYHLDCLSKSGEIPFKKFCSKKCYELYQSLHQLLGISHPTSVEGLTWKLLRSTKHDCYPHNTSRIDSSVELSGALEVLHECFQPVTDPHTKRDLVHDVIYNSKSNFRRLDFRGFYVMILQKDFELVSVATIRIHGKKVAEMPLIGTPFDYRRQGMCRVLLQELEKMLTQLGVERIVLPAISQLRETWKASFGFSEMSDIQREEFFGYPFLCFYGTKLFQKTLRGSGGVSQESGGYYLRASKESKARSVSDRKLFGLCYDRKQRMGKENNMDGRRNNGNDSMCRYVYKRRRILASK